MIMQSIKLILDRINKDLTSLDEVIHKKVSIENSNNLTNIKPLDKKTLDQISHNLDKLDNIIKVLDEDS